MQSSSGDTGAPVTAEWRQDKLMSRVQLGDTIMQATTDGVALDAKGWRVEFPQGGRRPALQILLTDRRARSTGGSSFLQSQRTPWCHPEMPRA